MSKADPQRPERADPPRHAPSAPVPPSPPNGARHKSPPVLPPAAPAQPPSPPAPVPPAAAPTLPAPFVPAQPIGKGSARQPLPIRPLVAGASSVPQSLPSIAAALDDEAPLDLTNSALHHAPPFLVSMLVHMLLVIVLALFTFRREIGEQLQLSAVYAESLGEQLLDDKLQSPQSLDMNVETPVLSYGLTPVNDPFAAPPVLLDNVLDPNRGTSMVDAPNIGMALTGRESGLKQALLPAYGGNATTEGAVLAGLEWLKKQQKSDGGWSLMGPYQDHATIENRCSATAMALLAFQGYGVKHTPDSAVAPDYHDVVARGWKFLLNIQNKDGFFVHEGGQQQRLYAQAQATIALCEIYGMTRDPALKKPAQLALDFAHKAQSPELGGWRYEPRMDSDLSVTGWYVMALQSGLMAGLEVQSPNLALISKFLDSVALEGGSQYCYQPGREASLTMTAEGLLCRQYLGWKHDDPRLRAGIDLILAQPISYSGDPNVYYWYYATQACHHMDGADWNRWNAIMRQAIPAAQSKTGLDRGSWNPAADRWGAHGGRLYVTCLNIYMLETYYRHLPIYKWRLK